MLSCFFRLCYNNVYRINRFAVYLRSTYALHQESRYNKPERDVDLQNRFPAVVKAVIHIGGQYLMLRRSCADEISPGIWECPGGKIEFGETLEQALYREVDEETGLEIEIEKLLYATTFFTGSDRQVVVITYLCRAESDGVMLSEEHTEHVWTDMNGLMAGLDEDIAKDMRRYGAFDALK